MNKEFIHLSVFSIVLFLVALGLKFLDLAWVHPYLPWIVVFYWLQFVLMNSWADMIRNNIENADETYILLGGVAARILIALMTMIIVVIVKVPQLKLFIVNFAVLYLHYLVFEIKGVLSNLRSNLK